MEIASCHDRPNTSLHGAGDKPRPDETVMCLLLEDTMFNLEAMLPANGITATQSPASMHGMCSLPCVYGSTDQC